jgi:hypothetical protein
MNMNTNTNTHTNSHSYYGLHGAVESENLAWIKQQAHRPGLINEAFMIACKNNQNFDFISQIIDLGVNNLAEGCRFLLSRECYPLLFDILTQYGKAHKKNLTQQGFFNFFQGDFTEVSQMTKLDESLTLFELIISLMPNHTKPVCQKDKYYDKEETYCYAEVYNMILRSFLLSLQSNHYSLKRKENILYFIITLSKKKFPLFRDNIHRIKHYHLDKFFTNRLNPKGHESSRPKGLAHHQNLMPGKDVATETLITKHLLLHNIWEWFDIPDNMTHFITDCWSDSQYKDTQKMPNEQEIDFLDSIAHKPYVIAFFARYFRYDRVLLQRRLLRDNEMKNQNHCEQYPDEFMVKI